MAMTFNDFLAFWRFKSHDVFSNGQYKRYVSQKKENGDSWAVELHAQQNKIQYLIKQLQTKIHHIAKDKLGIACKNVINSAQPPIKITLGISKCFITDMQCDKCIDLSKHGKKSKDIQVHCKFAYFFLFLWFICKLEYVIRSCTKHWIDCNGLKKEDTTALSDIADKYIQENELFVKNLFAIFEKAYGYVINSLDQYNNDFVVKPILQPPAKFWEKKKKYCHGIKQDPCLKEKDDYVGSGV